MVGGAEAVEVPWTGPRPWRELGWESTLQSAQSSVPHHFCFFLPKGWDTTNSINHCRDASDSATMGAPSPGSPVTGLRRWGGCLASETWESNEPQSTTTAIDRIPRPRVGNNKPRSTVVAMHRSPRPWVPHVSILRHGKATNLNQLLTPPATPPPDSLKPSVAMANNSPAPPPRTKQKPHTHTSMDPSGSRETAATAAAA